VPDVQVRRRFPAGELLGPIPGLSRHGAILALGAGQGWGEAGVGPGWRE